ncbi:MAG: sulfate adenylyltransferase, partial [Thermoplasmata archaeon]
MIPAPHGGRLVDRRVGAAERERREAEAQDLPMISPFIDQVYDAEKIGIGAYSPLEGFQDSAALESILSTNRLPNGLPWTMPILLAPTGAENLAVVARIRPGDAVGLRDTGGRLFAVLHLEEKFGYDKKRFAQQVYATTDPQHPNVADLLAAGDTALAGRIDLIRRLELPTGALELDPTETRDEFSRRGWKNV